MKIDLDALKLEQFSILLAVVDQGSFAAVAQQRNISASSISRTIQGLETQLGFQLFERSTRHLELTEAGAIYCESIQPGIELLKTAQMKALDSQNVVQGKLRMTLPPGFAEVKVIPLLAKFHELHPRLNIELLISDECLDFTKHHIDLAIRVNNHADVDMTVVPLHTIEFCLCASASFLAKNPIEKPDDLNHVSSLHFLERPDWHCRHLFDGEECTLHIERNIYASNVNAVRQMCDQGMGIALLPSWLVDEDIEQGRLQRLLPDYEVNYGDIVHKVNLVYSSRGYLPMKTRVFAEFLEQELSELRFG